MRSRSSGDALCFRSFHASVFMTATFPEAVASKGYCHVESGHRCMQEAPTPPRIDVAKSLISGQPPRKRYY
jgi:hypothetical protein